MTAPGVPRDLRFLDPAVLARLGTLELKARTVVEGFLTGLHRSPNRGFSVEFAEYRQYLPGDDLARIDWKVYARSDRHYIKKFEEETNLECHVLLDVSASMGYGSRGVSKLQYASLLAASLAFLMQRQRDAVGLTVFDDRIVEMVHPGARASHLHAILGTLDRLQPGTRTDVSRPLQLLADGLSRRGMVVLISDLLDDPQRIVDGLRPFRYRGTDVLVFQVLDADELSFPFEGVARFRDMEGDLEVLAASSQVRESYLAEIERVTAFYRRELGSAGIDYVRLDTSQPLDAALAAFLATRARSR